MSAIQINQKAVNEKIHRLKMYLFALCKSFLLNKVKMMILTNQNDIDNEIFI